MSGQQPPRRNLPQRNLETLFLYRQATGFRPQTAEPDEGWQLPAPPTWTDSKQRRREAIKKMAMGQKFSGDQHWEQTM